MSPPERITWMRQALLLMDDVDDLVRHASVCVPAARYGRGAKAFWAVCHMLAKHDEAERTRGADLDEADRRAGAAEQENARLRSEAAARSAWLSQAKREAGYPDSASFDVVWAEMLAKASGTGCGNGDKERSPLPKQ